jgi:excisionase family DNA binding protein
MKSVAAQGALDPSWYTVPKTAQLLAYGETKGWMLIISGDLRSVKDERARRVLPEGVEDYVRRRGLRAEETWGGRRLDVRAVKDRSLSIHMGYEPCVGYHERRPSAAQAHHRLTSSGKANTAYPIGNDRGRVDEPNAFRTQRTAASPRWRHCPEPPLLDPATPQSWGRPPSSAASQRTPRPRTCGYLLGPSGAAGNADASRFAAVASSRLCPDGRTFVPRPDLYIYGKWTRYGSPSHSGPGRRTVEYRTRFVRRLIAEHRIEFVHVGRHVRTAESALARFVEAGSVPVMTVHGGHRG